LDDNIFPLKTREPGEPQTEKSTADQQQMNTKYSPVSKLQNTINSSNKNTDLRKTCDSECKLKPMQNRSASVINNNITQKKTSLIAITIKHKSREFNKLKQIYTARWNYQRRVRVDCNIENGTIQLQFNQIKISTAIAQMK